MPVLFNFPLFLKIMTYLSTFLEKFLNKSKQMIPQVCFICDERTDGKSICDTCLSMLPYYTPSHCPVCGIPTNQPQICATCSHTPPCFVRTQIGFHYAYPLNKLIQRFKYQADFTIGQQLGLLWAEQIKHSNSLQTDIILPMPSHPSRLRERGFNQAVILAKVLGMQLDKPVVTNACHRIWNTTRQATLDRTARETNLIDAFVCETSLSGCHIALVDDVMTTGATLYALAQAALEAGAKTVELWALARAFQEDNETTSKSVISFPSKNDITP